MDLSLLDTLRFKIATSKVFADVFAYFYDNFGDKPEFMEVGEAANDELLESLLGQLGAAIFKTRKVRLENMRLVRIPEYNFIHGGLTINGAMANVLYCDDLQQGLLMISRPGGASSTQFTRFTAEMLAPSLYAESSKFKN